MIVDEGNKLMYCELPKVGSSNWKRVLIKLTDERFEDIRNVLAIRKPRKLDHYNLTVKSFLVTLLFRVSVFDRLSSRKKARNAEDLLHLHSCSRSD
jgi:hypothetical protein